MPRVFALVTLAIALASCSIPASPGATPGSPTSSARAVQLVSGPNQPVVAEGELVYTNDIAFDYYTQNAVALVDLYGFVTRDRRWEIPVDGQALGFLEVNRAARRGSFRLRLPALPGGTLVDVDNDGQQEPGVQVFAVAWWPNLAGGPFAEGDDRSRGWPTYLASTVNDPEQGGEVTGGKIIIWSPDAAQSFPSGFGPDGRLFTPDDPVAPVPAGYALVDLDQRPFAVSQAPSLRLDLFEPADAAIKDISLLSYTAAFDALLAQVRREYAFNGVAGKEPAWDALAAELRPRIAEAERRRDPQAFGLAVRDFTLAFRDGHVSAFGGAAGGLLTDATAGGFGLAARELDDGRFLASFVQPGGPASQAGVQIGAELIAWNGRRPADALAEVPITTRPISSDVARRLEQARLLLRAPLGTTAALQFANPGQPPQQATLTAINEVESYNATLATNGHNPYALPVEFDVRDSRIGYVRINSNYDDLQLLVRLFERALATIEQASVRGVVIDMRQNFGGQPLGLASYLAEREILLAQRQYFSEASGRFENDGPPERLEPTERTYRFERIALLVDQGCFSACEYEAYAFSRLPSVMVFGHYPTAGVYAEVARGQFRLPEGISVQIPTGRSLTPEGAILLEGVGVVPSIRVPLDAAGVLSGEDLVLQAAERAILGN
jgi:C-terminal processing protease CtpA/Prc